MKPKSIVVGIMLTLLLINTISLAFFATPTIAYADMHGNNPTKPDTCGLDKPTPTSSSISEDKPSSQEASKTSSTTQYEWNFNYTNKWNEFAYVDGNTTELVVGLRNAKLDSHSSLKKITVKNSGKIVNSISIKDETVAVVVRIPLNHMSSFVTELRDAGVASYIEPNMKFEANIVPNDPYWSWQWGPQKIEADWAWNTTMGDPSVLVAVVDTGIDWNHPDLAANYLPLGRDWVNNDDDPMDDHGHGTHCAGIIAGVINNDMGIAGLAQVRIMGEKGLNQYGSGYEDQLADAIIHAVDQGADIISMSWGGYFDSELIYQAIRYAYDSGVLLVAAAGNEGTSTKMFPAAYDEVIAVAATDQNDGQPGWTNYGNWIELAAPGVNIYSTIWDDGYAYMSGTSMACPHVSGVAALVWSRFPGKARDWVRLWLRYKADDLGAPGFDIHYGYGRINARKAVEQVPPDHELVILNWETPIYVEPGDSGIINATILNFGEHDENDVMVQLLANDTVVDSTSISFLASGASTTVSCLWSPTAEGAYNVTLYVVPVPGETIIENNVISKYIYVGVPMKAVVLHSAGNNIGDIIANWQVLNSEWHLFGDTMIYIDYTTLNKDDITYADIAATEADVLIISCAYDPYLGWQFTDAEIEAIGQYVREGHGLIATAGTLYYSVPNNNKLAPLFGLKETTMWDATNTDLLHLLNASHPLLRDVPDPLVIPAVGTNIPFDGRWDSNELAGGEYLAKGHYEESAIVTFKGLVYISPWLEIIPPYYHHHLQLLYNAITWSRYQKPEHELVVSVEAPKRLNPGEPTILNATVSNKGRNDETNVKLQLFVDDVIVNEVTIPNLLVDSSYTLSYSWTPTIQGAHNVTAYAPPLVGEEFTENNVATKTVMVLLIAVEKVLVYTDDPYVAPSSRYPIVALDNLGISYTHYVDSPYEFGAALVSQPWDLVIVDHCNYYALGNFWTELETYVLNGGFLILSTFDIDGSNSEPTTLWNTLGAQWVSDVSSPEPVYRWIPTHPLFTFPNKVGDLTSFIDGFWDDGDHVTNTTGTAVAGFTTSPTGGYAGIVVGNEYQTVLFSFLLCEFRYDQDADGKLDAVELWENAIAYTSKPLAHDIAVKLDAPKFLKPGESSLLTATVTNKGLNNEINVELNLLINDAEVSSTTIPLLLTGQSYTLNYMWTPMLEGTYNITTYAPPVTDEKVVANNWQSKITEVFQMVLAVILDSYGTDNPYACFWDYLSTNWAMYGDKRIVIDYTSLNKENITLADIQATHADVLIISDAWADTYAYGWEFTDSETEAIKAYVLEGHGIIGTSGTLDTWTAPNNVKLAELFGMDPTIEYNWGFNGDQKTTSGIFNLQTPRHDELWRNILDPYLSGELTTLNPIPSTDWATQGVITGWIEALSTDHYAAVITNEAIHRAVYFTCMLESEGSYTEENRQLFYNAIVWAVKRPEHELIVNLDAPLFLEPGGSTLLNATVRNLGLNNETDVELQLLINGTVVKSTIISELLTGESLTLSYLWTPTVEGTYNVTAYAPPVPDEEYIWNNIKSKIVRVLVLPNILIVADDDAAALIRGTSLPEFESALTASGYDYFVWQESTMGRPSLEFLTRFKLVIWTCGDFWNWAVDPVDAETLEAYLAQGGNLLLEGEDIGYNHHEDQLMINVAHAILQVDKTGAPGLTVTDSTHPVTQELPTTFLWLQNPPYDDGVAPVNGGFEVIRYTDTSWTAVTVFDGRGTSYGSVVYYSFPVYCLWQSERDTLIINSVRWLLPLQHDLAVKMKAPTHLQPSDSTLLNATVSNIGLNYETGVELRLLINDTVVSSIVIPELLAGSSYTISYSWTPMDEGTYNITAYAPPVPEEDFIANNVATKFVIVRPLKYVLFDQTHVTEYMAMWYKIWVTDLTQRGYIVDAHTSGPINAAVLAGYDVFVIPRACAPYDLDELWAIQNFVFSGGGLLVIGDDVPSIYTDLTSFAGITWMSGGTSGFTSDITPHEVTLGVSSVYLDNPEAMMTIAASAQDLIRDPSGNIMLAVSLEHVIGFADDDSLKDLYINLGDNLQLANNMIDWLAATKPPPPAIRDVAIVSVTTSTKKAYAGSTVDVTVIAVNEGNATETFAVTAYYDTTPIGTQTIFSLTPGTNITITIAWNTKGVPPCINYTIWAEAAAVPGETDTADNKLTDGTVRIKFMGDINDDGKVDIKDLRLIIKAFGSYPSHPRWNLDADFNGDGKVDIKDLILLLKNFGRMP